MDELAFSPEVYALFDKLRRRFDEATTVQERERIQQEAQELTRLWIQFRTEMRRGLQTDRG